MGKRRAKVRKAEGKGQESGEQKSGEWRAMVRKVEGKGQESGGQRSEKQRAKVRKVEGKAKGNVLPSSAVLCPWLLCQDHSTLLSCW